MPRTDTTLNEQERKHLATKQVATVARALNVTRATARRLRDGLPCLEITVRIARQYIAKQVGNALK